jgi:hypothetical protein
MRTTACLSATGYIHVRNRGVGICEESVGNL